MAHNVDSKSWLLEKSQKKLFKCPTEPNTHFIPTCPKESREILASTPVSQQEPGKALPLLCLSHPPFIHVFVWNAFK